jgi:hypothetical protein
MKKTVLFIALFVTLSIVCVCAHAEYHCPNHPNAGVHDESGWYFGYDWIREPYSVTKHKVPKAAWFCSACYKFVAAEYSFEEHTFSGNVCTECGYTRPSQSNLKQEASYLIYQNNIYNHACWVMYFGKLYASPSSSSTKLGELDFGEGYYVNDYQQTGNTIWIELKKSPSDPPVGWTTAEILSIDQKKLEGPSGYEVGRTILITTSSGRGRADAGTEFPYLETVHYGDTYTVLDAKTGTNGNAWYKIRVDGREVWISSGLGILQ